MKDWLIAKLGGITLPHFKQALAQCAKEQYELGELAGIAVGERKCKVAIRPLPLPFTAEQLRGAEYGQFITPINFGCVFGECNIPAPGPYGYEHRAFYVSKTALDSQHSAPDLICHNPKKFGDNVADSPEIVPVIVTVLR